MLVERIILKNWRNFKHVDVEVVERIFLVGPNASGKSNFLDVFRFLRDIAKPGGGLQKAVIDRGGISKIRCLAARKYPDIEIEIHMSDDSETKWQYAIGIKQESRGYRNALLVYEKVVKNGELILNRPDEDDNNDELRLTQTYIEQIIANQPFRDIQKFFGAIGYLHLVPQLVKNPYAFKGQGLDDDPFGLSFLDKVAKTHERLRNSKLKKIEAVLRLAIPQLKRLSFQMDDTGFPHLQALYEHWRPTGAYQQEDQFSDGTLRIIGLMWVLLEGDSLLLLEEPELSLNAGIVEKLPGLIFRIISSKKKNRQIMLSTHSSDLLSDPGIGGEEILLLSTSRDGTEIRVASSILDVKELLSQGFSVGDAVLPRVNPRGLFHLDELSLFEGEE
ncbi:MAG: chromosome segregation protein SMC [Ignavibacteria bacterium CG22_combo_CG10-13_8_21_14_all_37_15]|nr:MAG: chromosome segregation protein SMC [Ignavibacteria bacterium CG22_combo_CG10-13_8_21_14_all_37_15]